MLFGTNVLKNLTNKCVNLLPKPAREWRIGTEHEKFVYDLKRRMPLPYEAAQPGEPSIKKLLESMQPFGWQPVREGEHVTGLTQDGASVSLEPGGQFELSGAPLKSVHQTCAEVNTHRDQVREICHAIGAGCLGDRKSTRLNSSHT